MLDFKEPTTHCCSGSVASILPSPSVLSDQASILPLPSPAVLTDLIQRIVHAAQPERIILFGSAARGTMRKGSDYDVLVIKRGVHRRRLAEAIYRGLVGLGVAVDVIVATPDDLEQYGNASWMVLESALREGVLVYERPTSSTG